MSLQASLAAVQVSHFLFPETAGVRGHKKVPTLHTRYSIYDWTYFFMFVFLLVLHGILETY